MRMLFSSDLNMLHSLVHYFQALGQDDVPLNGLKNLAKISDQDDS